MRGGRRKLVCTMQTGNCRHIRDITDALQKRCFWGFCLYFHLWYKNKNLQKNFCECLHPFANRSSITKIMKISFTLSLVHKPLAFSMMRVKLRFHLSFTLYLLWPPSLGQGWAKDGLFRSDWALITPKSNIIWKENNDSSWWKQSSQEESA